MNIFLVERKYTKGLDIYDSFVVITETEQEARETHPGWWPTQTPSQDWREDTWVKHSQIDQLIVTHLGVANPDAEKGIVITSFNAA